MKRIPCNAVLCRYDEIGTKGRNRHLFETRLIENIRRTLRRAEVGPVRVKKEYGRIFITPDSGPVFAPEDLRRLCDRLPRVFGLASFSPAILAAPEFAAIERVIDETFPVVCADYEARHADQATPIRYAMRARRNNPQFPMRSHDLEVYFAEKLLPSRPQLTIDLRNPQLRVEIEVRKERAFVSYESLAAAGGLPTGTGGNVLAMLSGGIDSPVACHRMMRRGCKLNFATFHSSPYTPPEAVHKVARLVHVLRDFQAGGVLFAINLITAQKAIRGACQERFRTILYRRMMVRICDAIADRTGAIALCTGDNLGQVASQTLPNMQCISAVAKRMILRPLVAMDKQDVTAIAREIGTFDLSRVETPDSCSVFAPKSPATNAPLERILADESHLDVDALVGEALARTTVVDSRTFAERPADWHP